MQAAGKLLGNLRKGRRREQGQRLVHSTLGTVCQIVIIDAGIGAGDADGGILKCIESAAGTECFIFRCRINGHAVGRGIALQVVPVAVSAQTAGSLCLDVHLAGNAGVGPVVVLHLHVLGTAVRQVLQNFLCLLEAGESRFHAYGNSQHGFFLFRAAVEVEVQRRVRVLHGIGHAGFFGEVVPVCRRHIGIVRCVLGFQGVVPHCQRIGFHVAVLEHGQCRAVVAGHIIGIRIPHREVEAADVEAALGLSADACSQLGVGVALGADYHHSVIAVDDAVHGQGNLLCHCRFCQGNRSHIGAVHIAGIRFRGLFAVVEADQSTAAVGNDEVALISRGSRPEAAEHGEGSGQLAGFGGVVLLDVGGVDLRLQIVIFQRVGHRHGDACFLERIGDLHTAALVLDLDLRIALGTHIGSAAGIGFAVDHFQRGGQVLYNGIGGSLVVSHIFGSRPPHLVFCLVVQSDHGGVVVHIQCQLVIFRDKPCRGDHRIIGVCQYDLPAVLIGIGDFAVLGSAVCGIAAFYFVVVLVVQFQCPVVAGTEQQFVIQRRNDLANHCDLAVFRIHVHQPAAFRT